MAQSLAECRHLADLTRLQQVWSREAAADYTVEPSKVLQLASRTAEESIKTLREQAAATMRAA